MDFISALGAPRSFQNIPMIPKTTPIITVIVQVWFLSHLVIIVVSNTKRITITLLGTLQKHGNFIKLSTQNPIVI